MPSPLHYHQGQLYFEQIKINQLKSRYPTPFYLYSETNIQSACQEFKQAIKDHWSGQFEICYAMKANSNSEILKIIQKEGLGADVVSLGELKKALKENFLPEKIVFSGVGKTSDEIQNALLLTKGKILALNVESKSELDEIETIAKKLNMKARVSLRTNPKVKAGGHKYISTGDGGHKFGIDFEETLQLVQSFKKRKHLQFVGLSMHIGSQLTTLAPIKKALKALLELLFSFSKNGPSLEFIDVGGGLGIDYFDGQKIITPVQFAKTVSQIVTQFYSQKKCELPRLIFEPGRFICGRAGILVTQVIREKKAHQKRFTIVDAGMNDLIRPCLYGAYHRIWPSTKTKGALSESDVVGPICESSDFFAKNRPLPAFKAGDLLVISETGAYGRSMGSTYNSRALTAEYILRKNKKIESLV